MKKIGIQTCTINNFGACLQAYAMLSIFNSSSKYKAHILPFDRYNDKKSRFYIFMLFIYALNGIRHGKIDFTNKYNIYKTRKRFESFRRKYLHISSNKLNNDKEIFKRYNEHYDAFVCGSDIIWNPNLKEYNLYFDMLAFADDGKGIIAYSPSFGITEFPSEHIKLCKQYLERFDSISCREQAGVNLLKNTFNLDAINTLDPTLMVTKDKWNKICTHKKITNPKSFYFIYFFDSEELKKLIDKLLSESNYDIYLLVSNCDDNYVNNPRVKFIKDCGPREFLYYIKNARCVFANSLHALAFSINFNTPFIIFDRDNLDATHSINSRMDNMLTMFESMNRKLLLNDMSNYSIDFFENVDFDLVNKILKKHRDISNDYISKALKNI